MATYTYVHVDCPEGLRLKDLVSARYDFMRCAEMCKKVIEAQLDGVLRDSLSVAIPIVYARVFGGGVRSTLRIPTATILSADECAHHQRVLKLRSMHVAHSINRMESQRLRAWLNPEERGKKLNNVNAEHVFLSSLASAEYQKLLLIVEKLSRWIETEITIEETKLKPIVEQKYGIDGLYAMTADASACGGMEHVSKGRNRV
jgi:hypothetical protein